MSDPDEGPNMEVDGDSLLAKLEAWGNDADQHWSTWAEEAREDYDMVAGRQWEPEAIAEMEEDNRIPVTFNRIETTIDAVSGAEIMGRQEVTYLPRTVEDTGVTDVLSQGAQWLRQSCDAEDEESEACRDTLICGIGVTETRVSYDEEPDGQIIIERCDPLQFKVDPSSKKANFADARYIKRDVPMSKEEAEEEFGDLDFDQTDSTNTRTPVIVDPQVRYKNGEGQEGSDNEVKVTEYQWFESYHVNRIQHPITGEEVEIDDEALEVVMAESPGVELQPVRQKRRRYWKAFVVAGQVHDKTEIEAGQFTYKFITGKRDRNKGTYYGLVRPMKSPQRFSNKFFSSMLEQFIKGAKGGVMAEEGAVADQRQFENSWAQSDAITWVPNGSLSQNRIQEKPNQPLSPALPPMLEFSVSSIRDVTGVNLEMLGGADRQQPGILEHQRKQAAYGILSAFFNAFRRYRKIQGRLFLKMMQLYLPEDQLVRIVGDDGEAKYVPLALSQEAGKYDVIVDEAPTSPNQKERIFAILTQFQGMIAEASPEIQAELVKYSPLPAALSEKLVKILMTPAPPDPMAEKQAQLGMAGMEQNVRKVASEATENEANAKQSDAAAAKDLTEAMRNDAEASLMQTVNQLAGGDPNV